MGVPAFFRWLSRKYPSVIVECVEDHKVDNEGNEIPPDASGPNPNGIEFDNLYLDMNGIIHPCTHPEDKPAPKNEDEMMVAIFECIDRLFAIVRPRKLLYMAIDGVAPRAKMNQQRSRRYRASKEAIEKAAEIARIRTELQARGALLPPEKEKGEHFDSNCITPGTPFMERLSRCLHYYIHDRLNSDPGWRSINVILSDANVPGEGEHKIMDYIRKQRAQPDYDPNLQHVLCGADADLIMLGLATHEPHFTIIREEFLPNKPRPCEICSQVGHEMGKCEGILEHLEGGDHAPAAVAKPVQFIFVRLCVLKEYLERELEMPNLPFEYNFERVIDDWVFMCFFVGNDFLPHLPSLEIRENAIDRLITLYKKCVYRTKGYLTESGEVNLERIEMIMQDLGNMEDQIFKQRQQKELQFKQRLKNQKREQQRAPNFKEMHKNEQFAPVAIGRDGLQPAAIVNARQEIAHIRQNANESSSSGVKRKADDDSDDDTPDEVRLWEDGFKDRYYESKFDVLSDNIQFRYNVALQYVKGLCWVLKYYYQGCASWNWYFPYHYAPFASDFINIAGLSTKFETNTKPFQPLEQLMSVFPTASSSHVPDPWAELMKRSDSPIIDFYPEDFKIDLNGKKFAWQGVALLPFVDERRLYRALEPLQNSLTSEEEKRNKLGNDRLYVGPGNEGYKAISALYEDSSAKLQTINIGRMTGLVLQCEENVGVGGSGTLDSPILGMHPIRDNVVVTVSFMDPKYDTDFIFPAIKLEGVIDAPRVLKQQSFQRGGGHYRPQIGMTRDVPIAQLGNAGHRMMNHYSGQSQSHHRSGGYDQYNQDHGNRRGGYNNHYEGNYQQVHGGYRGGRGGGGESRSRSYNSVASSGYDQRQQPYNNYNNNNRYGGQAHHQNRNAGGGDHYRGGGGGGGGPVFRGRHRPSGPYANQYHLQQQQHRR